MYHLYGWL
ncbi:hypothetical protein Nmel_005366, partial [Mimus melanotis]